MYRQRIYHMIPYGHFMEVLSLVEQLNALSKLRGLTPGTLWINTIGPQNALAVEYEFDSMVTFERERAIANADVQYTTIVGKIGQAVVPGSVYTDLVESAPTLATGNSSPTTADSNNDSEKKNNSHHKAESEAAIRALGKYYNDSWNKHDSNAISRFYGDDGDIVIPTGRFIHGRQAIQQFMKDAFSSSFKTAHASFKVDNVRLIGDNTAIVDGGFKIEGADLPGGATTANGHQIFVACKKNGAWYAIAHRLMEFLVPQQTPSE